MNVLVTSRAFDPENFQPPHPRGEGRYWLPEGQFLYTLLSDPFILEQTGAWPLMREAGDAFEASPDTILFYAEPTSGADAGCIEKLLAARGRVVMSYPDEALRDCFSKLTRRQGPPSLVSLRERWEIGAASGRQYFYPDRQPFYRLDVQQGRVLSWIGDNPDLLVTDDLAIFSGDVIGAALTYSHHPIFSDLLFDLSSLLAQLVYHLTGAEQTIPPSPRLMETRELRRDYQSFGYACLTIIELARCYGEGEPDLSEARSLALEGARQLAVGYDEASEEALREAFRSLEKVNRQLQPQPAIFLDTLHGGGLFEDLGYFEFDWPQHTADVLRRHLDWANRRGYRFNVDFAALSVRNMAQRFPRLFDELRQAEAEGKFNFVNGTMNQSHPPYYGLESQIRQFDCGRNAMEEATGHPVEVFASQEFGLTPQTASILAQQGYKNAVLRVQHLGDVPPLTEERIRWVSANGDEIVTLPGHPYVSEQLNAVTYNDLHLKIFAHQQTGLQAAVFTGLGDVTYYRPFREELARICHYAPVFGRFMSWSEYFATAEPAAMQRHSFVMDQMKYPGFMELPLWSAHREAMGNFNSHCIRSMRVSHVLAAAELIEGVALSLQGGSPGPTGLTKAWEDLTVYQGHDSYLVPFHSAGGFMGGVTHQGAREAGRAMQTVVDYCGSWDSLPVIEKSGGALSRAEIEGHEVIARSSRQFSAWASGEGYVVYWFGPACSKVVRFEGAAGSSLSVAGISLPCQQQGSDLLALIELPANGWVSVERRDGLPQSASTLLSHAGDSYLENHYLRAEFDIRDGTLQRLVRRATGSDLVSNGSHHFRFPDSVSQRVLASRIVASGPVRSVLEFDIEVLNAGGERALIRSRATLDAGQTLLHFQDEILECPELRDEQWSNNLSVGMISASPGATLGRAYFNVLEPSDAEKLFSVNLLTVNAPDYELLLVNAGNEFYLKSGDEIRNVLVYENEPGRSFTHAVGYAAGNRIGEARSAVQQVFVTATDVVAEGQMSIASFIEFDSDDIELLSCRFESGRFLIRVASLTPASKERTLTFFRPVSAAWRTDLRGVRGDALSHEGDRVKLKLRPWDIQQIELVAVPQHGGKV